LDNAAYALLTRQSGLISELRAVANNVANANTGGFRAEGVIFSEHIAALGRDAPSMSMAAARVRDTSMSEGAHAETGGPLDLAITGDAFFLVATSQGDRLTRAGHFSQDQNGDVVTPEGHRLLDAGGAPVFVPPGVGQIGIAPDGTISADGAPIGQVGLYVPSDPTTLTREDGVLFVPGGDLLPAEGATVAQGFLEDSNVDAIGQITRMIAVQRAYELGQSLLDREDSRIRNVIQTVTR
jgi:flagellar basal-body rod protein FlgF